MFSLQIFIFMSLQIIIRLVDNMEAGFSHFAAVLGSSDFNALEKEQKCAALTSLQSQKYYKNQTARVKGNIRKKNINFLNPSLYLFYFFTDPAVLNSSVNLQHIRKKKCLINIADLLV